MERNNKLFKSAKEKRLQGKSYSDIHDELGVAKSTLSVWFSREKWSTVVKKKLRDTYRNINTTRLVQMNKAKHLKKLDRHKKFITEAKLIYTKLKQNRLFNAGVSIYWGEGEKTDNGRVSIINTDVEMIQVMALFFRKILVIPDDQLRGALFIYEDISPDVALDYWSKMTKIPKNHFIKTQVIPSRSRLTKRRTIYGMCNIYFSSTEINIKMREWIKLFSADMRV